MMSMQMMVAEPPLQYMYQIKKLGGATDRTIGAGIFSDDNCDVTLTNATKECMKTAYHE